MLRSRNTNIVNNQQPIGKNADLPTKRAANKQIVEKGSDKEQENCVGEPKAKRAVLSELRNQITSGLLIDSSRKVKQAGVKKDENTRGIRRNNSSSEELACIIESPSQGDQSIVVLESSVDPCPEYDYDKEMMTDPFHIPEYAADIFKYSRFREAAFKVHDYTKDKNSLISKDHRALLVDWMIEVQETFELNHETLYLAVKLVDIFLANSKEKYPRDRLQLIGSAAIFIASKYDERQPPLIDDFLYVSDDSYTRAQLEEMEKTMLRGVFFDLGAPLSYSFIRRYAKACKVDMQKLTLGRYILETSLMYLDICIASESEVAAGAFLLALRMIDGTAEWTPVMQKYSGLKAEQVEPWVWTLNHMLHMRLSGKGVNAKLVTAYQKYSHEIFYGVASLPLIPDRHPIEAPLSTH